MRKRLQAGGMQQWLEVAVQLQPCKVAHDDFALLLQGWGLLGSGV